MIARNDWECLANAGYNVGNQECIFANLLEMDRLAQDIEILPSSAQAPALAGLS